LPEALVRYAEGLHPDTVLGFFISPSKMPQYELLFDKAAGISPTFQKRTFQRYRELVSELMQTLAQNRSGGLV